MINNHNHNHNYPNINNDDNIEHQQLTITTTTIANEQQQQDDITNNNNNTENNDFYNDNNNPNDGNDDNHHTVTPPTLIHLPIESIIHCLSFLHSKDIFHSVIPVCHLFQQLTYTNQLWDSIHFCTLKNSTHISTRVLNQFPIRHMIINSKQFSIIQLMQMNDIHLLKSVTLCSIVIDYRHFINLMNRLTRVERLTLDKCKIINYFEPPIEPVHISNPFTSLKFLECKMLQGDYETKLKILQILVSRCRNVTSLTMIKNNALLLSEMIYDQFHPEMQLESLTLEEEHLFAQNVEYPHRLDQFFARHCSLRLKKLALFNCRHRFDTLLSQCSHTLEHLIVVSGFWNAPLNELPYPVLPRLVRLVMISCHIQVVQRILSDCVISDSMLQIKLSGPPRNHVCQVRRDLQLKRLKSLKSHHVLPLSTLIQIVKSCENSLQCLEFAFAKRTALPWSLWHSIAPSLSQSLIHLSMDNVRFDDQWWLLKLLRDLKRLETLRIETATSTSTETDSLSSSSSISSSSCDTLPSNLAVMDGGDDQQQMTALSNYIIRNQCGNTVGNNNNNNANGNGSNNIVIEHDCLLRVLVLEDCDIGAECFDQVLRYCGTQLLKLSCDFSYDNRSVISSKMQSIAQHCQQVSLTINCMDQVPTRLHLFSYALPYITINMRDLSLEDMVLLAIVCDEVRTLELNMDQGTMNIFPTEASSPTSSTVPQNMIMMNGGTSSEHLLEQEQKKLIDLIEHVIRTRVANFASSENNGDAGDENMSNNNEPSKMNNGTNKMQELLEKFRSIDFADPSTYQKYGNVKGLLRAVQIHPDLSKEYQHIFCRQQPPQQQQQSNHSSNSSSLISTTDNQNGNNTIKSVSS